MHTSISRGGRQHLGVPKLSYFLFLRVRGSLILDKYQEKRSPYERERFHFLASLEGVFLLQKHLPVLQQRTGLFEQFLRYICTHTTQCYHIPSASNKVVTE